MSLPIEAIYVSNSNIYCVIHSPTGTVWNGTAFETFNAAHWASYAIALTEQSPTGYYSTAYPSGISGLLTTEVIYLRGGGSPADTDTALIALKSQGANILTINYDAQAPINLQTSLDTEAIGAVASGAISNNSFTTNLADTTNNVYAGRILIMISGAQIRQVSQILAYNGSTKVITLAGLSGAPAVADAFIII